MGNWNSGRRPAPTAIKALNGIVRNGRINRSEPAMPPVPSDFAEPPEELAGDAVACDEWRRLVAILTAAGVITSAERSILVATCVEWSRYVDAQKQIRTLGMLVKAKAEGMPVRNPYIRIGNDALKQLQRFWIELGLTPSSRSRLSSLPIVPAKTVSKWSEDL